jgi:hypothetical protein
MRLPGGRRAGPLLLSIAMLAPGRGAAAEEPAPATAPATNADSFARKADELIHDNNYDVKSTAHYKVKTDDPRVDVIAAARLLESFRDFFEATWKGRMELQPGDEFLRVYLFYSRGKLKQLDEEPDRPEDLALVGGSLGTYASVALHTDAYRPEEFPGLLIHGAAHQLVQQRLYGKGNVPSFWVAEGLATYFDSTHCDRASKWTFGEIGTKEIVLIKGAGTGGRSGWSEARTYRRALEKGEAIPLDTVLRTTDHAIFYDTRVHERDTAAWLLVHYLLHADGGAHVAAFVTYMKHDATGDGSADTLYRDLGMTGDQLVSAFSAYLARMKQP